MADYAVPADDPSLFPDDPNKYAIVVIDTFKPPDSGDFINKLAEFEDADFELPSKKQGYQYYIYRSDGETFGRDEWPPEDTHQDEVEK